LADTSHTWWRIRCRSKLLLMIKIKYMRYTDWYNTFKKYHEKMSTCNKIKTSFRSILPVIINGRTDHFMWTRFVADLLMLRQCWSVAMVKRVGARQLCSAEANRLILSKRKNSSEKVHDFFLFFQKPAFDNLLKHFQRKNL